MIKSLNRCTSPLANARQNRFGTISKLTDDRGVMRFRQFRLNPKVLVKYLWDDAPEVLQELCLTYPGTPEFIVAVPNAMRFTDLPEDAFEILQLEDGFISFV
jgi:hypothetical protein